MYQSPCFCLCLLTGKPSSWLTAVAPLVRSHPSPPIRPAAYPLLLSGRNLTRRLGVRTTGNDLRPAAVAHLWPSRPLSSDRIYLHVLKLLYLLSGDHGRRLRRIRTMCTDPHSSTFAHFRAGPSYFLAASAPLGCRRPSSYVPATAHPLLRSRVDSMRPSNSR